MKKVLFLLLVLLSASPCLAVHQAQHAVKSGDTPLSLKNIDTFARDIQAFFPKLSGEVVSVNEDTVVTTLTKADGVFPGMRLSIFRVGKEFRHPVTKEVLGRFEEYPGTIEIVTPGDKESTARLVEKKGEVKAGDKIRVSSDKITLALIPASIDVDRGGLYSLNDALLGTERFEVTDQDEVSLALLEEGFIGKVEPAPTVISKLAGIFNVQYIAMVKVHADDKKANFDVTLYSGEGKSIARFDDQVNVATGEYRAGELGFAIYEGRSRDYWRTEEFRFIGRNMVNADVDGDGRRELVINDGERIHVSRYVGNLLQAVWTSEKEKNQDLVYLDAADLNKDGIAEIYVTNVWGGKLKSYVLEYRGGEFRKIWQDVPLYFRIVNLPKRGPTLITQEMSMMESFRGEIRAYERKGDAYTASDVLNTPKGVEIYGFGMGDIDEDGKYETVVIDDEDLLVVYDDQGKVKWKSAERYGGFKSAFDYQKLDKPAGEETAVTIKGRVLVTDLDGDEKLEIAVIRNVPVSYYLRRFKVFQAGEIHALRWENGKLEGKWKIKDVEGYIYDFTVGDIVNDGRRNVAVVAGTGMKEIKLESIASIPNFFRDRSRLFIYHLPSW
ncbi:MAG: VCBS repeat-containing protein [Nitrospirota bacterium]|nr:VCBS repeat-containing protein [Nitrospirota bacterium]